MTPQSKQVVVSDAYRFAYIKLPKTAGTSVHYGFFNRLICPIRNENDTKVHHYFNKAARAPIRANCSEDLLFPSLDRGKMPGPLNKDIIEKLYHYFVFAVVRNPWKRAVSAYEYCYLNETGSFQQFAQAPQTFGEFCSMNKTIPVKPKYPNFHWHLQSPELCDITGTNCLVDYVVDLDNLPVMMDEVVGIINERRNQSLPVLPMFSDMTLDLNYNRNNHTYEAQFYAKYYKDCPQCEGLIRGFYAEDVSLFGYEFPF